MRNFLILVSFIASIGLLSAQKETLAILKYRGGGDWYSNPTALKNLSTFCNAQLQTDLSEDYDEVSVDSPEIFNYPFVHMTGHGNVVFNKEEAENLALYLQAGGFLHIDDNYGMDEYLRKELKRIFPNNKLIPLSRDNTIFTQPYLFEKGLPKIHEHDNKAPEAWGIYFEDRLALVYSFESDLSDGWEDAEVHNDPEEKRLAALKMGANLVHYAFTAER
jgi:hypothetical protein